jgi:hypothetical protein
MRITSTGIIAVGTTTPNTTNKLEVSGNVGLSWAGNTFIGMKYNDGNAYKMGMQLNSTTREAAFWSQSSDSDDKITFYTGSGPTERMRITTAGYLTMPYQPCWYVIKSDGNTSASGVIIYNGVVLNVGSGYNVSNGRFTAPITGTYQISITGISVNTVNVEASVNINGSSMIGTARGGSNASSTQAGYSTTFFYPLTAGDYIQVNALGSAAQYGFGYYTSFAGRLVG